jgi:succinoglycan biosynthesis transport protein ExoP
MIEIRVYSRNKAEAARIANKIAEVYRESRLSEREGMSERGIKRVEISLKEQQAKVESLQAQLDDLKEQYRITDLMVDSWSVGTLEADAIRRTDTARTDVNRSIARVESTLNYLKGLDREGLRRVLPSLFRDDVLLVDALQKHVEAEARLVQLTSTLAEDHPDVKGVMRLLDKLNRNIEERMTGIVQGLQAQATAYRTELGQLDEQVKKATDEDLRRAKEYREYWLKKRKLENEKIMLDVLSRKVAQETFDKDISRQSLVTVTDFAEEGLKPVKPNIPLNIAFGVVVGLVVGIGLAFFIEYLDTSVKTIDDVERALQAPVLGVIPQNVGSLLEEGPDSPHAEAYRVLRTNVLFTRKDETFNTITIVSGGAGEGKSTTLFNLAVVFAQNGNRVLIVDSDLRRPSMHKFLKVSNTIGLTNFLLGQNKIEEVIQTTSLPTLDFLPSGKLPSSSMGILSSAQMKEMIKEVKRRYDFVFFDSPPIMGVSDAVVLASEVDISLQVIQYRKYPQAMTLRAKQMVAKVGGYLVGIVLNNINMSQDENYYYYSGYYYDYYQSRDKDEAGGKGEKGEKGEKSKSAPKDDSRVELKKKY